MNRKHVILILVALAFFVFGLTIGLDSKTAKRVPSGFNVRGYVHPELPECAPLKNKMLMDCVSSMPDDLKKCEKFK